ncbi:MAG: non-homologous end-joining DNA ligase, partial [Actinobacteria bacterium]|nr:non-homologous end-joining DNA ligase [Actinomycetota bacterium]
MTGPSVVPSPPVRGAHVASVEIEVDGRVVAVSSPDKPYFPAVGMTKLDLVQYHLAVADVLLPHCRDRPLNLERYPNGVDGTWFMQKRVPEKRPAWLRTVEVTFGSGRTAEELCPASIADVLWAVNIGCITVHPWSITVHDTQHPDELRVDLDPQPGVAWDVVRRVTAVVGEVLGEVGLRGHPKTSGSRGMHVVCRIEPEGYVDVRRAAVALAREVERRVPDLATSSWWKEERGDRVFLDYNQNLWDRTMACAYAVRAVPDARVSAPVTWDEVVDVEPEDLTVATMPARLAEVGDLTADLDEHAGSIDGLLALAAADDEAGLPDLPLPPHFPKFANEPKRVPPSR